MDLEKLKKFIIEFLDNSKISDITTIDVSKKTTITKLMIIGTATSTKHADSTIHNLRSKLKETFETIPNKAEGKSSGWVLLDLNDIFVNIFTEEARQEYKLEELWTKEIK
ncbi:MAG: ribosome silencing factor [Rickettsiales bacterium]|nr:ribosome silencing factor [Rickettsiales bacterium]